MNPRRRRIGKRRRRERREREALSLHYAMLYDEPLFDPGVEPDEDDDHGLWAITFADPPVARRGNRRRREDRRARPPFNLYAPSSDTPTMNLPEKMASWRKMREREPKEYEEPKP